MLNNTEWKNKGENRLSKKVAAIILNYNSSRDCEKCLEYLREQDYDDVSIIVVDNNSTLETERTQLLHICNHGEKLIFNDKNRGFSAGNNVGIELAEDMGADWILIINPDVEIRDTNYISFVMNQLSMWPEAVVAGTNIELPNGKRQNPMRELNIWEEILWPLEMIKQKIGCWDGYLDKPVTGYCEKLSGCCFFISVDFLKKNNNLDENVFMYCEEAILASAVKKRGYKELYINEALAKHEHYKNNKEGNSKSRMLSFFKSRQYYIEKYSDYSKFGKIMAIFSRKMQCLMWKHIS